MKEITFADLKRFDNSNSSVMVGVTPDYTPDEVDELFHEVGFYNNDGQHCVDLYRLSDRIRSEEGKSDILVVHSGGMPGNTAALVYLCRLKRTSDFIANYANNYKSR